MSSSVSSTPVMTLDHLIQQDDPQHHTFVVIVQDISPYQQKILALPTQNSELARATGGKQSQIKQMSSALIGDSTKQFVKLTLWGEKARVLDERQGPDAVHIGDIVVCSGFYICNRRGTIEIRGRRDSRMAVMLRNDVYHPQSSNIKIAQIQSLLDARGQILLLKQESSLGLKSIAEARENMILSVLVRLGPSNIQDIQDDLAIHPNHHTRIHAQVMMYDSPRTSMGLNLWEQFSKKEFTQALMLNTGTSTQIDRVFEISNVIITSNARTKLEANTTAKTTFHELRASDPRKIQFMETYDAQQFRRTFSSFHALRNLNTDGEIEIQQIQVRQMIFPWITLSSSSNPLKKNNVVEQLELPAISSFIEAYCGRCNQPCPDDACSTCHGIEKQKQKNTTPIFWRYKCMMLRLADPSGVELQVTVPSAAIERLLSNIPASSLADPNHARTYQNSVRMLLASMQHSMMCETFDCILVYSRAATTTLEEERRTVFLHTLTPCCP